MSTQSAAIRAASRSTPERFDDLDDALQLACELAHTERQAFGVWYLGAIV